MSLKLWLQSRWSAIRGQFDGATAAIGRVLKIKPTSRNGAPRRIEPRRVRLEASSFCQLRCPSCPTTTGHIHPAIGSGFLKFDDFRELLQSNPALEQVEISNYGEVFLNPQLMRILEYAHQKNVAISIGNGANLNHVSSRAW